MGFIDQKLFSEQKVHKINLSGRSINFKRKNKFLLTRKNLNKTLKLPTSCYENHQKSNDGST